MLHPAASRAAGRTRPGKTLVLFILLVPVLLGMTGLVIDGGLVLAAQRQAQNAADGAALAAAFDKFRGSDDATALATANDFVAKNGLSGVSLTLNASSNTLNIPYTGPSSSPGGTYVEVMVSEPVHTLFIQILGVNANQQVTARAVAGYEPVGAGEGVFVLDPTAAPGLQVNTNNTRLIVNGDITVNSQGGGVDQFGATVSSIYSQDAVKTSNSTTTPAPIVATTLNVVGGVTDLDNIRAYDAAFSGNGYYYDTNNTDRPVLARVPIAPDPLTPNNTSSGALPTPTTNTAVMGNTPVQNQSLGSPAITGNGQKGLVSPNYFDSTANITYLYPGIYQSISISGGTVVFQPGIYVLSPQSNTTTTLQIQSGTVTGNGVMFYNTGALYNPVSGTPDSNDLNTTPNPPKADYMGSVSIGTNSGTVINFTPLVDSTSPFNGFLFYQRRWNTASPSFTASNNATLNFAGILYAKNAQFKLSGQGAYNAQFLVGSMAIDGGATVTINAAGKNIGKANLVFLVE